MGFAHTHSVTLLGVDGVVVEVQADLEPGIAVFTLVGLPDKTLSEARDRVRAAVTNSGEEWPQKRLTVGLSPATVPKTGAGFDLAVACAVLSAGDMVPSAAIADLVMVGELGLDGRVRPVRGILPSVMAAAAAGLKRVVVPASVAAEARLVPGVDVIGVHLLAHLLAVLRGQDSPAGEDDLREETGGPDPSILVPSVLTHLAAPEGVVPDLREVAGQHRARRALEVCAAGGHHLFLLGPPGAGKTLLAERLPGILPRLDAEASLEVSAVHSVAGTLAPNRPLMTRPPFCAPHHSATMAAMVGGGSGLPRPGAASLSHRGVLFLDEAPEFPGRVLDALRQPLESGTVSVARTGGVLAFPARFQLVMAANPCPCGMFTGRGLDCTCSPLTRAKYLARLSGPLLDRVDLRVGVDPVSRAELFDDGGAAEPSAVVAERVREARERAAHRLAGTPWRANGEVPGHELRTRWAVPAEALAPVAQDLERGFLTARGMDRVLRVAWTLADLGGRGKPGREDVHRALMFRVGALRSAASAPPPGSVPGAVPGVGPGELRGFADADVDRAAWDELL